jgi:hypothetical protein
MDDDDGPESWPRFATFEEVEARDWADRVERLLIGDAERVEDIRAAIEGAFAEEAAVELRVEAALDEARCVAGAGRPPQWPALCERMRTDGMSRDQVERLSRRERSRFAGGLARRYGVDLRLIKKALGDL